MNDYNLQAAELIARVFAGILFLFQGYDKLFKIKMPGVIATFLADAESNHVPRPLLVLVAYFTSIVEFAAGIMLLLGFCTSLALYALGFDLVLVCLAFTYIKPMWDLKYVFPRLLLIIALLLMPAHYRLFTADHLFSLR